MKILKLIFIIAVIAIAVLFFGSIVLSLLAYVFDAGSVVFSWLGHASRWVAELVDLFGFAGIFA